MKKILLLVFSLICSIANAELFVCQSSSEITQRNHLRKIQGDCMRLGVCSDFDNKGINPNCIIASKEEYDSVMEFKKLDFNVVSGSRVIDMTQAEQDALTQAEADAQALAEQSMLDRFDVSQLELMTALIKRINVRIPNNPITKSEIIQQIKADR